VKSSVAAGGSPVLVVTLSVLPSTRTMATAGITTESLPDALVEGWVVAEGWAAADGWVAGEGAGTAVRRAAPSPSTDQMQTEGATGTGTCWIRKPVEASADELRLPANSPVNATAAATTATRFCPMTQ
jgi:hypothetical protein